MTIDKICAAFGISTRDLARIMNVNPVTLDRWRNGRPPKGLAAEVLTAFRVSIDAIKKEPPIGYGTPDQILKRIGQELQMGLASFIVRGLTR